MRLQSHPMWVRGLKQIRMDALLNLYKVAPHVGAWIETKSGRPQKKCCRESHPMWVRGLKQKIPSEELIENKVAPHVGAWIETILFI